MAAPRAFDALIIGGGHNGLVCAFYLARAGLSVCVLERRAVVGGAAVTEAFATGFRNSTASYTVSLLSPQVIAEMGLAHHGLRLVLRPEANFLPDEEGQSLVAGSDTQGSIARLSPHDAARLPAYSAALDRMADVLRGLAGRIPPGGRRGLSDLAAAALAAREARGLDAEGRRLLWDFMTRPAAGILREWFDHPLVQALFAFDSIVGTWASPEMPGTGYVLLHHVFGEVNGRKGAWGHAIGGMGAITGAMAAAAVQAGVEIRLEAPVARVLVDGGRARGVRLESGEELHAPRIIANVGPKLLFTRLVAPEDQPPGLARRMAQFRTGSASFRMNLALSGLPRFTALPDPGAHLAAGIILAPSIAWMDRAYTDSRLHGWSRAPVLELLIPSLLDDSLAPRGAHVMSVFAQHFAPALPDGRPWEAVRDEAVATIIATIERFAPGFGKLILGQLALSPADLEARFGLVDGDIFHGQMGLDQLWAARPMPGAGDHRMPIPGLWLCGSGAHPGGGVTGLPGRNAARAILKARRHPFAA
jgi:phytoene dehydrogenase-like protein